MLLGARVKNFILLSDLKVGIEAADVEQAGFAAEPNCPIPFSNLTAFIGRNGAGKSLFLEALSFFSDSILHGCSYSSTLRGRAGFVDLLQAGAKSMEFSFLFLLSVRMDKTEKQSEKHYLSYTIQMEADGHGRPYFSNERIMSAKADDKEIIFHDILVFENGTGSIFSGGQMLEAGVADRRMSGLKAYGSLIQYPALTKLYNDIVRWFFCDFSDTEKHKGIVAPGGHRHLNEKGSNVENVLKFLKKERPEEYEKVVDKISQKIPSVKHKGSLPDSFRRSPNKLFLYLLLLEDMIPRPLICIETPGEGLYHDMVDVLMQELRNYTLKHPTRQIFFTSHNPYVIESLSPEEVWIFSKIEDEKKISVHCAAGNPEVREMYKQGVGMGAIWYAGHFDEEG